MTGCFIFVCRKLDYESIPSTGYRLRVVATDHGATPRFGKVWVRIRVTNTNDEKPQFQPMPPERVTPSKTVDSVITTVIASDPDGDGVTYKFYVDGNSLLMISSLVWHLCRYNDAAIFFTSHGLALRTTIWSITMLYLIVGLVFELGLMWGAHTHNESLALRGFQSMAANHCANTEVFRHHKRRYPT